MATRFKMRMYPSRPNENPQTTKAGDTTSLRALRRLVYYYGKVSQRYDTKEIIINDHPYIPQQH